MSDETAGAASTETNKKGFRIRRIYLKDVSFEAPNTPVIFTRDWKPNINLQLNTNSTQLEENIHEVVLTITVTATVDESTAYLAEIQQAGIFAIRGFEDDEIQHSLGSYCPAYLYPYASAALGDLVSKGGFPSLMLAPVNFDAIYARRLNEAQASATGADSNQTSPGAI